ncbi:hypothetical protein RRG08_009583 [Elysia crispata]|uniref:Uncharacterized protein n=1 Tax=Elysia crispata TaxID=231223 RepID=A0AAE0XTK5_9GAST|nr:hypothetical protein RRG08_009583 [Elysia crispata]
MRNRRIWLNDDRRVGSVAGQTTATPSQIDGYDKILVKPTPPTDRRIRLVASQTSNSPHRSMDMVDAGQTSTAPSRILRMR